MEVEPYQSDKLCKAGDMQWSPLQHDSLPYGCKSRMKREQHLSARNSKLTEAPFVRARRCAAARARWVDNSWLACRPYRTMKISKGVWDPEMQCYTGMHTELKQLTPHGNGQVSHAVPVSPFSALERELLPIKSNLILFTLIRQIIL